MAEIIQVKSRSGRNSTYPHELMRAITGKEDKELPRALCTIVTRKGSAPRDVGAKMLVYPDGRIQGTIGGGCVESDIIRSARSMLDGESGSAQLFEVDMTADAAADAGMVCGGIVEVLVEIIEPGHRA